MKAVLIQNQIPSKVIYNGNEYNTLCEFAVKNKIYEKNKRKNLCSFLFRNFKQYHKNNTYNIDLANEFEKEKFRLYLLGKNVSNLTKGINLIYKKKLYVSIANLAQELGIVKIELQRILYKNLGNNLRNLKKIKIDKNIEKDIQEKIEFKKDNKRKDCTKIIYSNRFKDYNFKSIKELARKINFNYENIYAFISRHNIQAINYEIDLNNTEIEEYQLFRSYIEKNDKKQDLIPLEGKLTILAESKGITLYQIKQLMKNQNLTTFKEVEKFYKNKK